MNFTKVNPNIKRLSSPDMLRGLLIILMALDHANYFVTQKHSPGEYWGGPFPIYHDALPFLTRFFTHFAAPGFFFLMGIGMTLFSINYQNQGWSKRKIMRHFWIRGILLMVLQLLIVNRAWEHSPQGWNVNIYIGVLFALGGAMILGSFILWSNPLTLLIIACLLFIGTEFLVPDLSQWNQISFSHPLDYLNPILIRPGGTSVFWSNYPILPWLELVIFGMVFGHWLSEYPKKAYQWGLILGFIFLILFGMIRILNGFGNIRPQIGNSWIDFFNVVKYPPSMSFTLLTTGINLILLWVFSKVNISMTRYLKPLFVFGREPLFFYILHLFIYAGLGFILTPNGTTLLLMFPIWIFGLVILYPLCQWYGEIKKQPLAEKFLRYL